MNIFIKEGLQESHILYFLLHYIYLTALVTLQIQIINAKCNRQINSHELLQTEPPISCIFISFNIKVMHERFCIMSTFIFGPLVHFAANTFVFLLKAAVGRIEKTGD